MTLNESSKNLTSAEPVRTVDLLVIGAGPAGMAAAIFAKLRGLDVVIIEKSEMIGGTASTSAGTLWIPENSQGKQIGDKDSITQAAAYLDSLIAAHTHRTDRQRDVYFSTGVEAIDVLQSMTEVKFLPCGEHPDYHAKAGAAVRGRAIVPAPFDARMLGRDFERVRPPIDEFMIFGGMMVGKMDIPRLLGRFQSLGNFIYSARLFLRYLTDRLRFSRGTRLVMGNALVARMYHSLLKLGVRPEFGTCLGELLVENGRVTGATVAGPSGTARISARKGVILATGGFAHNAGYRERLMPQPTPKFSLASTANQGEGIAAAEALGARISETENGSGGFWTPVSVTRRKDGTQGLFPHLSLDRAKPGLIAVNRAGRRFCNEADSYHDFVEAMYRSNDPDSAIPTWLICDGTFIRKYGLGHIYPGTTDLAPFLTSGYLVHGETPEALAKKLGIDAAGLEATLSRYNEQAARGVDEDFHKGHSALNRFNGDPQVKPNPCLAPVGTKNVYAMAVWPAEIACSAGISTDEDARVVDGDENPIPGLYACGNDMASVMGDSYPGPGTTLGPAVVFAYRAVNAAARERYD
ncbi:succinate dehydrogenase/fumarate reductase flavoprotein subunit [Rhizobium petrolearium]|uniref:FAD-dependent oxidoreductase n=2 Tax=Neorhizobium TaxID=1525371 RepID=A0ABV0MCU8_9HYPH|nr:FAD-dependent oxidoreductase [Neorhizobium petrolearium]MBP1848419.1 succinate dehydrogenase/fumarate reductase flavoprotein subunit [Neorhizobium petrolearium]MCC2614478.1 FAD-dependent oxidoreductase [Neorhizobium petrolearium]WGI72240.1 FAD-dependent oxidoreductase [Neorhizobium petrolearium]